MKNNKSYFLYQLKSNSRPLIVITVCALILGFYICIDNMDRTYSQYYNDEAECYVNVTKEYPNGYYYDHDLQMLVECKTPLRKIEYRDLMLVYPIVVLIGMCYIVPVWLFSFMKKRRNLDCCYSLPISRRALGMTNYLVGLILVFVPFILSYIQNLIIYASYSFEMFTRLDFLSLMTHFLICILMGLILYTLFVFVFNEANSVLDGVIFIGAFTLVAFLLLFEFYGIVESFVKPQHTLLQNTLYEENAIPWAYFGSLLSEYEEAIERSMSNAIVEAWADPETVFWFIFWTVVGILSAIGFFLRFDKIKAEKTEDISDSIFGYRTLIPLLSILGVIVMCYFGDRYRYSGDPISAIFITFAAVIGYTIYRRGVKYKKSDYAVIGILLFFTLIAAVR